MDARVDGDQLAVYSYSSHIKVKEIFWYVITRHSHIALELNETTRRWKHAASCHQGSNIPGERDFFFEDEVYQTASAEDTLSG